MSPVAVTLRAKSREPYYLGVWLLRAANGENSARNNAVLTLVCQEMCRDYYVGWKISYHSKRETL